MDPYALCPSGDGWTILQAYQNNWNPFQWQTPPAPQGLTVSYNSVSGAATLNWQPSPGPVTGYTVEKDEWNPTSSFDIPASTHTFHDTVLDVPSAPGEFGPTTWVMSLHSRRTIPVGIRTGAMRCRWSLRGHIQPLWLAVRKVRPL